MDSANMLLCKEFVVAFHRFLGAILVHNACGDAQSRWKTHIRHYTEVIDLKANDTPAILRIQPRPL